MSHAGLGSHPAQLLPLPLFLLSAAASEEQWFAELQDFFGEREGEGEGEGEARETACVWSGNERILGAAEWGEFGAVGEERCSC